MRRCPKVGFEAPKDRSSFMFLGVKRKPGPRLNHLERRGTHFIETTPGGKNRKTRKTRYFPNNLWSKVRVFLVFVLKFFLNHWSTSLVDLPLMKRCFLFSPPSSAEKAAIFLSKTSFSGHAESWLEWGDT